MVLVVASECIVDLGEGEESAESACAGHAIGPSIALHHQQNLLMNMNTNCNNTHTISPSLSHRPHMNRCSQLLSDCQLQPTGASCVLTVLHCRVSNNGVSNKGVTSLRRIVHVGALSVVHSDLTCLLE